MWCKLYINHSALCKVRDGHTVDCIAVQFYIELLISVIDVNNEPRTGIPKISTDEQNVKRTFFKNR